MNKTNDNLTITHECTAIAFTYIKIITKEEAIEIQSNAGYHPAGYGFYNFKHIDGNTKWYCFKSCD
jgi:hypothetical protein